MEGAAQTEEGIAGGCHMAQVTEFRGLFSSRRCWARTSEPPPCKAWRLSPRPAHLLALSSGSGLPAASRLGGGLARIPCDLVPIRAPEQAACPVRHAGGPSLGHLGSGHSLPARTPACTQS